ncbi:MAG: thioredoxin family protein [Deltaproteobacteria bacterium]|nr:thioredoxin family protein [Deltaproteobacteria bacterium]
MKKTFLLITLFLGLALAASPALAGQENPLPEKLPAPGMVTLIDLGAATCIPCKMMEPILSQLKKEYEGKAAVVFIDLRYHKEMAQEYKIRAIPTQILYDKNGNEVGRHEGFLSKEAIENAFKKLGVKK